MSAPEEGVLAALRRELATPAGREHARAIVRELRQLLADAEESGSDSEVARHVARAFASKKSKPKKKAPGG